MSRRRGELAAGAEKRRAKKTRRDDSLARCPTCQNSISSFPGQADASAITDVLPPEKRDETELSGRIP